MTTKKKTSTKKRATKARTGATRGRKSTTGATAPAPGKQATAGKRGRTSATPAEGRGPSLLDAAVDVLKRHDEPMGAKELVAHIIEEGLWATQGKTPEATLYSALIREISHKGADARFQKVSRGRFALTDVAFAD